ncbi:MAG TPA: chemotaxis protein CheW [Acidobacteriota bacterium]|nr:chemotaxis protein CheW [Acidobacteriota bacterium]
MAEKKDESLAEKAGKYLTFTLGDEVYGLEILKVQEIIGMMSVTRVPRTPDFIRGVINLRGKVIPVVDLRIKFGLDAKDDTEKTVIIVVQVIRDSQPVTMGTIVDEVSEVMDIEAGQIEPPPQLGADVDTDFILGMGKIADKVVMLLDADKVLTGTEIELIDKFSQT